MSHTLRKTCGSNLVARGFTLKEAADYLGDTLDVFIKHYCYSVNDEEHIQSLLNKK